MSEDAGSSSSSAHSRDHSDSPTWSSVQSIERGPRRVVRTTEKSVVFRVRTQEKVSSGRAANRSSKQKLRLTQMGETSSTDDRDVHDMLAELYAEAERKKQWLNSAEETFRRGQELLSSLKREHAALLRTLEQCKRRRKERLRIQKMLRGPHEREDYEGESSVSDSDSDSDYSSHNRRSSSHHRPRDGAKKERKRLRRFQSKVSLQFQLLQSECRRSDLLVEKLKADLRREYADSCLFGNTLNF